MAFWKGVLEDGKKDLYGKRAKRAVMPLENTQMVRQQFGWTPASVYRPGKGIAWRKFVGDVGELRDSGEARHGELTYAKAFTRVGKCEEGQEGVGFYKRKMRSVGGGAYRRPVKISEFNPELCSVIVKYWSMEGDHIVDPFSGRATRGVVSLMLGRGYEGYDVAPTTIKVAKPKIQALGGTLHCGDGCKMANTKENTADLVMTCPPYHNIEGYESAPGQLSDKSSYEEFLVSINECARNIYRVLKPGKFCCWVCGDWREKGVFHAFHEDSSRALRKAGLMYHDIVIIENISPYLWVTMSEAAFKRRTVKTHEYLQVFRKPEVEK